MNRYAISTPEGTRDRLFSACSVLRKTERIITSVLKKRGFGEVITPSIEYYDVFLQADSSLEQEKMLKCTDRGGRILVLRPDSTTPIARIASTKIDAEELPLRLYYSQNVFRSDISGAGRRTEIMQVGAELLGADGCMADLDILSTAFEAMDACNLDIYRIELGHAGIYKALISSLGVSAAVAEQIRLCIESKNFAALGDILEAYREQEAYEALKAMPQLFGGGEVLEEALSLTRDPSVTAAIQYLKTIYQALCEAGFGEHIMIDLGLAYEMEYYTGIMFRGYMSGAGSTVISGGRYNALCEKFGRNIPAIGFAIDLDGVSCGMEPDPKKNVNELIFAAPPSLRKAISYMQEHGGVLAPVDSAAEAMDMAKKQGFSSLVLLTETEIIRKETAKL